MARWVGFGGTIVVMLGFYLVKVLCMEWIRDEYKEEGPQLNIARRLHGLDEDSNATPKLFKLLSDCKERAGLDDASLDRVEVFHSCLLDPVTAGTTWTRQGALVGMPSYMLEENIDLKQIRVKSHFNKIFKGFVIPDNLSEEDEKQLKSLLTVTPKEQNFLMSFALCKVNTLTALKDMVVPVICWPMAYFVGFNLNNKLNLFTKPRFMRVGVQSIPALLFFVMYICYVNASSLEADTDALAESCKTKEEVEVAIGYLDKVLERNRLLRRLVEGMEYYVKEDGELHPLFYEMEICSSLSSRKSYLNYLLEKFA